MRFSAQDKIMFVLSMCWFAFFFFIMFTTVNDDGTPAKFLFRQILLTFGVPIVALWLTGTMGRVIGRFKGSEK